MGVATLVRNAAKPLAMVGVTGLLSLGMVTLGSAQAEALAVAPIVAPVIEGATEAILPEVMAAEATAGPVGWGLLGLTVLAAATQDYWMPYVTGGWGSPAANNPGTPLSTQQRYDISGAILQQDNVTIQGSYFDGTVYPDSSDWSFHMDVVAHCKDITTGKTGFRSSTVTSSISHGYAMGNRSYNWVPCPWNSIVTGFLAGGGQGGQAGLFSPNLNTSDPQPAQLAGLVSQFDYATRHTIKWGDMAAPTFDAKSPNATYTATVECISADGQKVTISAQTSGDLGAVKIPSCEAAGLGRNTGKIGITGTAPGSTTPDNLWSQNPAKTDTNHPLCDPTLAGPLCKLQILIDGKPCVEGQTECIRWASLAKSDPSRVQCFYGPYQVALSNCNMLERAYEIGGAPSNVPNTDGDPTTRSDAGPNGQPQPGTQPGANPDPSIPRTGPGAVPAPAPGGAGAPSPSAPADSSNCWQTGWGAANPLEWVLTPLRCAFEPSNATKTSVNSIPARFQTKAPFVWMSGASALVAGSSAVGSSGCPNWVVNVGSYSQNVVCGSTFTNALIATRPSIFGLLVIAMFWPLIRSLWYAVVPIIRPTPMA